MNTHGIPYTDTGYFSELICDYHKQDEKLSPFITAFPSEKALLKQAETKAQAFPEQGRKALVEVLQEQYEGLETSLATRENIGSLENPKTLTVVTGHQLNLFTGPLYFLYKIVHALKLAKHLNAVSSTHNFVPVYWMATEDHDFDEINHFRFKGQKIQWHQPGNGPVGRRSTAGLEEVFNSFASSLGDSAFARTLKSLFQQAYLEQPTLAAATRFLVNKLFKEEGLVILDADDPRLKSSFRPFMERELFQQDTARSVQGTIVALQGLNPQYPIQVNPREINLFYITNTQRDRIIAEGEEYVVLNQQLRFSSEEIKKELEQHPERFSPNVITRPLYQEVILPNICYIGGGGELAYWLELKDYFEAAGIPFPILMLRNSILLIQEKQATKAEKLGVSIKELFYPQQTLVEKKVRELSEVQIDFSTQKEHLEKQFRALYTLAERTDKSFLGAVSAQEVKQKKGLENLEKRLLRAQKRKLKDQVHRLEMLQNELFPNQSLQERQGNIAEYYLQWGPALIHELLKQQQPLNPEFRVLSFKD